jgi:hypothetical protein
MTPSRRSCLAWRRGTGWVQSIREARFHEAWKAMTDEFAWYACRTG